MSTSIAFTVVEITREEAERVFKTDWWVNEDVSAAAHRQLFTTEMIMPFDKFYEGLKQLLKRDVLRAEVLLLPELRAEFLGLKTRPSGEELEPAIKAYNAIAKVTDERE